MLAIGQRLLGFLAVGLFVAIWIFPEISSWSWTVYLLLLLSGTALFLTAIRWIALRRHREKQVVWRSNQQRLNAQADRLAEYVLGRERYRKLKRDGFILIGAKYAVTQTGEVFAWEGKSAQPVRPMGISTGYHLVGDDLVSKVVHLEDCLRHEVDPPACRSSIAPSPQIVSALRHANENPNVSVWLR